MNLKYSQKATRTSGEHLLARRIAPFKTQNTNVGKMCIM